MIIFLPFKKRLNANYIGKKFMEERCLQSHLEGMVDIKNNLFILHLKKSIYIKA